VSVPSVEAVPVQFTVWGQPVPQGSKVAIGKKVVDINDARLRSWRHDVASVAKEAMEGASPYTEPVDVRLMFWFSRPKGHYGSGRNAGVLKRSAPIAPAVRPDLDKLTRAVLDALTGICFRDDSQVVGMTVSKLYSNDGHSGMMGSVLELRPD
jgi:crossover junction endodeoxyribonuclease RusA